MSKRYGNHHPNKIPPFRPDPEHWTRKSSHGWKAKVAYESEDEACEFLKASITSAALIWLALVVRLKLLG